jgi:hypothetical protein
MTEGLAITLDSSDRSLVPGYTDSTKLPDRQPVSRRQQGARDGVHYALEPTGSTWLLLRI